MYCKCRHEDAVGAGRAAQPASDPQPRIPLQGNDLLPFSEGRVERLFGQQILQTLNFFLGTTLEPHPACWTYWYHGQRMEGKGNFLADAAELWCDCKYKRGSGPTKHPLKIPHYSGER